MAYYPSKGESLWLHTSTGREYPSVEGDIVTDVVVIGGGIAGLSTAYLLKRRGYKVVVLEKHYIGSGVSGYTTAKVTSQHGLIYSRLLQHHGAKEAAAYGQANQTAMSVIEDIIEREQIECEWQRQDNYVFTENEEDVAQLQQEADDAQRLGLPASFVPNLPLPIAIKGAVKFEDQATFHISKYLQGLAAAIEGDGSRVFEQTEAGDIDDTVPCIVTTPKGRIIANQVVIATNAPYLIRDHLAYGLYEYPTRSYIVAGRAPEPYSGMAISSDSPTRSILPTTINGEDWLLIGGEGHFVGKSGPAQLHYDRLAAYARSHFGITDIRYRWSTWDFVAYDDMPLVGRLYPFSKNVYTATGFHKWGMTNATVAGLILTDLISGEPNPWANTFRSNRLSSVRALPRGLLKGIKS